MLMSPNAPSITYSGLLLDNELIPRTLIVIVPFGSPLELATDTPGIFPCNAVAVLEATCPLSSLALTELTAPER